MSLHMVIFTGYAGSGKSTALRTLEDTGYFCVDNLPTDLIEQLITTVEQQHLGKHLALVMDMRDKQFLDKAPALLQRLKQSKHFIQVVFLHAQEDALVHRYAETRRLHPLDDGTGLMQAIIKEKILLNNVQQQADLLLDTSDLTPHQLKRKILHYFPIEDPCSQQNSSFNVALMSFGFKYGAPVEANSVWDARFLKNPFFEETLKPLTGLDKLVQDHVLQTEKAEKFLQHIENFLRFALPEYQQEGKRYLTIAIGCTGGKHRSVALVEKLACQLNDLQLHLNVRHRDLKEAP